MGKINFSHLLKSQLFIAPSLPWLQLFSQKVLAMYTLFWLIKNELMVVDDDIIYFLPWLKGSQISSLDLTVSRDVSVISNDAA